MKSNQEWIRWGNLDPRFGVLTSPGREAMSANPWTDDEFYAHGGGDWEAFREAWIHYGVRNDSCVEIGCGAGRMTNQLGSFFGKVTAIDVSPGMIEYARTHVSASNVTFSLSDGLTIPLRDDSVTAAFSTLVFQHFESVDAGFETFRELRRVLTLGSSLFVEIPVHTFPSMNKPYSNLARRSYEMYLRLTAAKATIKRRLGPYLHGISYEMEPLVQTLENLGFSNVVVRSVRIKWRGDLVTVVCATKE
jgi:ubiquinone/menaquinone biosynthesis C-methylase UbiE